jgi:hypothetical protein
MFVNSGESGKTTEREDAWNGFHAFYEYVSKI